MSDPLWFKDAIIYEIPVRAFYDSDADGIGDFPGLIEKLDYVRDLGVTAVWILPFYPSPLRDGGYDIADYTSVHPMYGTLRDFKRFLKEAHRRGIRVITELVINHTSIEHPWFQRARRSPPGSRWRDHYVWSDTPERNRGVRIIFQDYETSNWTWDPVAKAYYWHRFYSHQPDLNFDHPEVRAKVLEICDFWLEMGVDGMRLDAIPYLYEREGTNCENLPETHAFLKELRAHMDTKFENRMLLAEANQWPEDAAAYFGDGDECHMNFHFPLMPRMFMAVQLESSFPILDIMAQTPRIPANAQWAVFLRNHDELTLEMVTDEDRDYMYRVYAEDPQMRVNLGIRRRLGPLLKERAKVELMTALLFSMPGTPVLYYGDEIGMGDNIYLGDRDAVRTPMQWSGDRNAGFSKANPQKLFLPAIIDPEYHYESVNVEAQQANSSSLLFWTKRLIALRKQYGVFGRGEVELLDPENPKVLAFLRTLEEQRVLIVANLSRTPQFVELDLAEHEGKVPVELLGHTEFPRIGELPYLLTLGPYGFYWLSLEEPAEERATEVAALAPRIRVAGDPWRVLSGAARDELEDALAAWLPTRRFFRGKARRKKSVEIVEEVPIPTEHGVMRMLFARVEYREGPSETYALPVGIARGEHAERVSREQARSVIARLDLSSKKGESGEAVVFDALISDAFADALLDGLRRRAAPKGNASELSFRPTRAFRKLASGGVLTPYPSSAEQSNDAVIFGDRLFLKLFRAVQEGTHPEEEMVRHLSERARFPHVPALAGVIELRGKRNVTTAVAIAQELVPSQGDAWTFTLDAIDRYLQLARAAGAPPPRAETPLVARSLEDSPALAQELLGPFLPLVRLLGQRIAELHLALDSADDDPAFAPEELTLLYQRSLYQSARAATRQTFKVLRRSARGMPSDVAALAREVLARQDDVDARLRRIHARKIDAVRMRIHGDLHLGQVLYTARDFIVIDFEGEPTRSLSERRFKRSPIRDVAAMLRSFQYAAGTALRSGRVHDEERTTLAPWLDLWIDWVSAAFLGAYRRLAGDARFVPTDETALGTLLDFHLLEKCAYEIGYELDNRPAWLPVPLHGLLTILDH